MRVGLPTWAMTLLAVNVLPVPVAPSRVCVVRPSRNPCRIFSIAWGWSPAGWNRLTNSNLAAIHGSCCKTVASSGLFSGLANGHERPEPFQGPGPDPPHPAQLVHRAERLLPPHGDDALGQA